MSLTASDPVYSVLARYKEQLRYVFIVSAVDLKQATEWRYGVARPDFQGAGLEVRAVLELFDASWRGQEVSNRL